MVDIAGGGAIDTAAVMTAAIPNRTRFTPVFLGETHGQQFVLRWFIDAGIHMAKRVCEIHSVTDKLDANLFVGNQVLGSA